MTYSIDADLQRLIAQQFPADQPAGCFFPLGGLTGLTGKVTLGNRVMLARREAEQPIPFVSRRREFHMLKSLASSGLVPNVYQRNRQWLLMEWLEGDILNEAQFQARLPELVTLMTRLHHQPLSGYRLQMLPLLESYWQQCRQRSAGWLRALRKLRRRGEPQPLRLATLHMDIHSGNLLGTKQGLRLIDWEYAGDGDIALELAAVMASNPLSKGQRDALIAGYAAYNRLNEAQLRSQMARWQPWLRLLIASWFQLRAEQSSDEGIRQHARSAWQAL